MELLQPWKPWYYSTREAFPTGVLVLFAVVFVIVLLPLANISDVKKHGYYPMLIILKVNPRKAKDLSPLFNVYSKYDLIAYYPILLTFYFNFL